MHSCEDKSDPPDNHAESGPVIPKPNLDFEDGTHSIFMIIQKFPFPVVVLCDTTRCPIPVDRSKFNFDLSQPLLFYRKRSIQKIPARSLFVDETDQYQEAGDPLLIPEDYKGYFAILKRRNLPGPTENNAPHFTKIEDIAQSDTETFLIGGQNRVKAFQVTTHKDDDQSHHEQQRMLFPGDVLRKIRMFTSETKKKTKYFRRSSLITERFLLCMDEADREVVIPFTQAGLFYALTTTSGKGTCPVMQMSEIVASKYLPCVVKLVYGRVPTTPCFFTGLLQLDHGYLEQSIVAATIMNKKNILVEIPSSCKMEFRVAHTNDELISNQGYQNAVQVCRGKMHSYMRNIKVCLSWKSDDTLHGAGTSSSITVGERVSRVSFDSEISEPPKPCSKDVNRDSGYMKMTPSTDDLSTQSDGNLDSGQDQYVKMVSPTSPPPDYVLKLFLENKLLEVPVYSHDANQVDEVDDSASIYSLKTSDNKGQHITTPPDIPPPPVPCPGTPPSLCGGSPSQDSGISDIGLTDTRRPSTFIFAENEQNADDDITYAIPQIPTRRVSAPPNFDTIPVIPDSKRGGIPKSSPFNKRKSKSLKNRVSSAPTEMLNKDGRLISPTETIHEHDFVSENPRYENIEGMKEIQEKLIHHKKLTESINKADNSPASHSPWYLGPLGSSDQTSSAASSSPPHLSPDDGALKSMPNENPRLSCGSVTSSDPFDSVFEIVPSDPTPHEYLKLIDAKVKYEVEDDHEDVYDVIPDIPGSNPLSTPLEIMHMSDKEYVDQMNSDLVEHEQPPNPHLMQHATHTYVNSCGDESKECEEICDHDNISLVKTECNQPIDSGSNSTEISEEPLHVPCSDTGVVQHNESVTGRIVKGNRERSSKESDSDIDRTDVDQSEGVSNLEEVNPIIVELGEIESATGQENPLEKDNVYPVPTGETCSGNKCGENEARPQEEEGYAKDDICDDKCQHRVQGRSGVNVQCGATESQQNDSNQRRREPISDNLVPPNEAHDDISLQIKPSPPPVSPKPSRTHTEKREAVSEEMSDIVISNSNESSQFEYIDDQPVHHQLKHRERTESNSISMSPEHLEKELKDVGVTRKARENIKDKHIGIEELLSMDVDDLQKDLPDVSFLDLKRIAMFIRNTLARPTGY
ncbi:uncharacterized protein LOC117325230 [Pecten maximus]|uniref:uncharacterized protein LOC117325230 n=1 Tax=Pecten maximus TaxID=6579 RepID=UPI0014583A69|nr:uncharacterized protein LOC117325230 [Pecten maximus]